ncbi:MAG: hypothetical protein ACI9SE_000282 [Neolewinella sp.]|jgi:hypothetical protein
MPVSESFLMERPSVCARPLLSSRYEPDQAGEQVKLGRIVSWLLAALPMAAAGYWASFAARMPEAVADRVALGEVTPRWDFANWSDTASEPMHVMARAVHLGALQVPTATLQSVVWVNLLLVLLTLAALCDVMRRAFPTTKGWGPVAFAVFGLLVASPAFGSNWLHGERLGLLFVPMLLVTALGWLHANGRFAGRAIFVFLVAAIAPWFHIHGVVVATALIPAMFSAANSAGSQRRMVWLGVLLVLGDVAAVFSLRTAGGLSVAGADWFAAWTSAPLDTLLALFAATGQAWLDLLPTTSLDDQVVGGACWLLPILLLCCGNRSTEGRAAAAPWWSCVVFGLLVIVINGVRYEFSPPVGTLREVTFGAFLLPIGLVGLLAARFGTTMLSLSVGAFAVLAVQDWHTGLEDLRMARMRTQQVEAEMIVPAAAGATALPVRNDAELQLLIERKWVLAAPRLPESDVLLQFAAPSTDAIGRITAGDAKTVHGVLRSSLRHATAQWIALVAKIGEDAPRIVGYAQPKFDQLGRNIVWRMELSEALPEGAQVRAMGLLVAERSFVPLGASFILQAGKLAVVGG